MNQVIWKYNLDGKHATVLAIPKSAQILSAGLSDKRICIWAIVNPNAKIEQVVIEVYGTGNPITENMDYRQFIGTVIEDGFVRHVFKVFNETEAILHQASKFLL